MLFTFLYQKQRGCFIAWLPLCEHHISEPYFDIYSTLVECIPPTEFDESLSTADIHVVKHIFELYLNTQSADSAVATFLVSSGQHRETRLKLQQWSE